MTAEEMLSEVLNREQIWVSMPEEQALLKAFIAYGLLKQNEILDKAAERATVIYGSTMERTQVNKQSILTLKNKL